jgi:hypothetical protein
MIEQYQNQNQAQIGAEKPQTEFSRESDALDREIGMTFEIVQALNSRLQPILRPIPAGSGNKDNAKPSEVLSTIAENMRRQRDAVRSIRSVIECINEQLAI